MPCGKPYCFCSAIEYIVRTSGTGTPSRQRDASCAPEKSISDCGASGGVDPPVAGAGVVVLVDDEGGVVEGGVVVATSVPPSDAMVAEAALLLSTPVVGVRTAPDGEIRAVLDRSAPPADLL